MIRQHGVDKFRIYQMRAWRAGVFLVRPARRVTIGDDVLMGPATHPTDPAVRKTLRELARPISVGNNVWLGGRTIVGPGVTIGDDTAIGAGSVVIRDIPHGVVAAGNPCRVIRKAR